MGLPLEASTSLMQGASGDVICVIAMHLSLDDVQRLAGTCALARAALDDAFYRSLAHSMYSTRFWARAEARPASSSQPLTTWRMELRRVEQWQATVVAINGVRWSEADFFRFWSCVDR